MERAQRGYLINFHISKYLRRKIIWEGYDNGKENQIAVGHASLCCRRTSKTMENECAIKRIAVLILNVEVDLL